MIPDRRPTVSIVVPSRDERARLPALLDVIEAQTLPPDEVVIADGMSTDGSWEWLVNAAATRSWLRVIRNPARTIPTALNAALAQVRGDYVARMDTHAEYDPKYLETLVAFLEQQPAAVGAGGAMDSVGNGAWGRAIAAVLQHPIGMGGAAHRTAGRPGPVEHVFTGCYRRGRLVAVGGFDERLLANEDYELDVRLRKGNGSVWLVPEARSSWFVPESLPALTRKMFRYGRFKAVTLRIHPRSVRARQLAPPLLVAGTAALAALRFKWAVASTAAYLVVTVAVGARVGAISGAARWRAALVPSVVHLSWGVGLLRGLVRWSR